MNRTLQVLTKSVNQAIALGAVLMLLGATEALAQRHGGARGGSPGVRAQGRSFAGGGGRVYSGPSHSGRNYSGAGGRIYSAPSYQGRGYYAGRGYSRGGGYYDGRFYSGRGYYYGGRFWARPYFGVGIGIPFGWGYYSRLGCGYYDGWGYWQPAPCYPSLAYGYGPYGY